MDFLSTKIKFYFIIKYYNMVFVSIRNLLLENSIYVLRVHYNNLTDKISFKFSFVYSSSRPVCVGQSRVFNGVGTN